MTALVPLLDFSHLVRPHVPDASTPAVEQALRLSAIDFCERTRAWRQVTTVTLSTQGQAVVAPSFASIFEIESATYNNETELKPTQYSSFEQAEFAEEATPEYITQVRPDTVAVVPFATGTLTLSLFLRPRHDREFDIGDDGRTEDIYARVPQFLLTQHAEHIAAGALYRLFITPGKKYTNDKLAAVYRQQFMDACDRHFTSTLEGQQNAPMRAEAHWF